MAFEEVLSQQCVLHILELYVLLDFIYRATDYSRCLPLCVRGFGDDINLLLLLLSLVGVDGAIGELLGQ